MESVRGAGVGPTEPRNEIYSDSTSRKIGEVGLRTLSQNELAAQANTLKGRGDFIGAFEVAERMIGEEAAEYNRSMFADTPVSDDLITSLLKTEGSVKRAFLFALTERLSFINVAECFQQESFLLKRRGILDLAKDERKTIQAEYRFLLANGRAEEAETVAGSLLGQDRREALLLVDGIKRISEAVSDKDVYDWVGAHLSDLRKDLDFVLEVFLKKEATSTGFETDPKARERFLFLLGAADGRCAKALGFSHLIRLHEASGEIHRELKSGFHKLLGRPDYLEAYRSLSDSLSEVKEGPFVAVLLAKWFRDAEQVPGEEFLSRIRDSKKNTSLSDEYLCILLALDKEDSLSPEKKLFFAADLKEIEKSFFPMQFLIARGKTALLNQELPEDPVSLCSRVLSEENDYINLQGIDCLGERYLETFGKMRTPFALETYERSVRDYGHESLRNALERFERSVLRGTFKADRYETDNHPHLQEIKKLHPEIFHRWISDSPPVALEEVALPQEDVVSLETFFKYKSGDGHWYKNGEDFFPSLTNFVQANSLEEKHDILDAEPNPVQRLCMQLALETKRSFQRQMVDELLELLANEPLEFMNDLKSLQNSLKEASESREGWTVRNTDDWQDLFLSGTDVGGSCLRVSGNIKNTKCLLAYPLDGKNRMIAVQDSSGKTVVRAMFRLLYDTQNARPVVFLDEMYPYVTPSETKAVIRRYAYEQAKALGCELVTADPIDSEPYIGRVVSFSSTCPFEYADAGGGRTEGVFEIVSPKIVRIDI